MKRIEVSNESLLKAIEQVTQRMGFRLEDKGTGAFAGPHEIYGILAEEFNKELLDALHENDDMQFVSELHDIAVSAIFAIASMLEVAEQIKAEREALETMAETI